MAINKDSNGYVFGFAAALVVVVGAVLTLVSIGLKPLQKENIRVEKMQNILQAIKITDLDKSDVASNFDSYVKRRILINFNGEIISENSGNIDPLNTEDAFNVDDQKQYKDKIASVVKANSKDPAKLKEELAKLNDVYYSIYVCEKDGEKFYVLPMVGTGLWGPIWGYVGLDSDYSTVYGATFDHKTETPGLGSEIKEPVFTSQFPGKKIAENGVYKPIEVIKPGSKQINEYRVDGITGGTITSVGVDEMLNRSMGVYYNFFKNNPNL